LNKKDFHFISSRSSNVKYEFQTGSDSVWVRLRGWSAGYLCLEVNSPDRKILPYYDRLLERMLLLTKQERRFWEIAYFHSGKRVPELESIFPIKYYDISNGYIVP